LIPRQTGGPRRSQTVVGLLCVLLLAAGTAAPRIRVAATDGEIIPQAKGGGGFQRSFLFRVDPVCEGRWIRQEVAVRGTVFGEDGTREAVHLDVVEYYRVNRKGRAIQADSHYSRFREAHGGDLKISAKLTYGALEPEKLGDPVMGKSFILRGAVDADGKPVTMRKRTTGEVIPAERGEKVAFRKEQGALTSRYAYEVSWDTRSGKGSRAEPSGEIERGTWQVDPPKSDDRTKEKARPRPIPELKRRR